MLLDCYYIIFKSLTQILHTLSTLLLDDFRLLESEF